VLDPLHSRNVSIDEYISKPAKPDTLVALITEKLAARERKSNNEEPESAENSLAA
jgi:DNA-binding response OmpR family regulator